MNAHVVVVGASLAGLAVAYRLSRAGQRVTVLEQGACAEPELATTPARTPELASLAASLGVYDAIVRKPVERVELLSRAGASPVRLDPCSGRGPRVRLRASRGRRLMRWYSSVLDPAQPETGIRFDDRSVRDWADLYLGRSADRDLFRPLLAAHFGLDSGETSRLALLLLLDAFAVPAVTVLQGVPALAQTLVKRLDDVRKEHACRIGPGCVFLDSGSELSADAIVLATPAHQVAGLVSDLRPAEELFFRADAYAPAVQLVVETRSSVAAETSVAWVRSGDGPLAAIIDTSLGSDPGRRWLLAARPDWAKYASEQDDAQISERLLEHAAALRPELGDGVERMHLHRSLRPRFDVGRFRAADRARKEMKNSLERRRLFYCDESLLGPHPEAAASRARQTSEEVLQLLG